jgi:H+-transporting ATPase
MATLASSEGGQDSVDAAIRSASSQKPASDLPKLIKFVPFDPARKMSEATATDVKVGLERIVKGAFTAVAGITKPPPSAAGIADELEKQGFRVLAVASGPPASMQLIGLIALSDPPRTDWAMRRRRRKSSPMLWVWWGPRAHRDHFRLMLNQRISQYSRASFLKESMTL